MIRLVCLFLVLATPLFAVEPDEILDDPALEARARTISAQVRCVVCQNEPIDTSNAGVAKDLRVLIRERLVAGDSDDQVYTFLTDRYGDYVLFKPPWKPSTYALWVGPFVILGLGALGILMSFRRKQTAAVGLDADDQAEFDSLMEQEK